MADCSYGENNGLEMALREREIHPQVDSVVLRCIVVAIGSGLERSREHQCSAGGEVAFVFGLLMHRRLCRRSSAYFLNFALIAPSVM